MVKTCCISSDIGILFSQLNCQLVLGTKSGGDIVLLQCVNSTVVRKIFLCFFFLTVSLRLIKSQIR